MSVTSAGWGESLYGRVGGVMSGRVRVLDVEGEDYQRAFELFLAGSDEKAVTHAYLTELVEQLPARDAFVDVGAGSGATTGYLARYFAYTLAVEPGAPMRAVLRAALPDVDVSDARVLDVRPDRAIDFVLCSHMLYYVPRDEWVATVLHMAGWLRSGGELVIVLQNPDNACMRMARHFTGARFDLADLAADLANHAAANVSCSFTTLPVTYRTSDLGEALVVAEFMVNGPTLTALDPLPTTRELGRYVRDHFTHADGVAIGHDHDILRVRRRP